MRTCGIGRAGRRFRWLLAAAAALAASPGCATREHTTKVSGADIGRDPEPFQNAREHTTKVSGADIGCDPQPFRDAKEFYQTANVKTFDARAAAHVKALTDELAGRAESPATDTDLVKIGPGGAVGKIDLVIVNQFRAGRIYRVLERKDDLVSLMIGDDWREDSRVWVNQSQLVSPFGPKASAVNFWWQRLLWLNPYRTSAEVQDVVPQWAEACAQRLCGKPWQSGEGMDLLRRADRDYTEGRFREAAAQYMMFLCYAPGHLDARNNLALAEMHLGNDLLAQVDLEALRRLEPSYLPATINLTLVYERMGLGTKARALAQEAATKRKNVPAAVYNAAWLADLDGKHAEAVKLLNPMVKLNLTPHKELQDLAKKQLAGGAPAAAEKR